MAPDRSGNCMAEKNITPRPHRPAFVSCRPQLAAIPLGKAFLFQSLQAVARCGKFCMRLLREMGAAYFCALILTHEFQ